MGALGAGAGLTGATVRASRAVRIFGGPSAERPLALALIDDARLLCVTAGEVELFRMSDTDATLVSHVPLPDQRHRVRAPAALISLDASGLAAWVLSNQDERAHLVSIDGERLGLAAEAEALPWQGSTSGLRYRDGTDWIEGDLDGLGTGPFLAIAREDGVVVVSTVGALLREKGDATRDEGLRIVGPMLAPLWPGVLATSTAQPPGTLDRIVFLERGATAFEEVGNIPEDGAIRALAGRVSKDGAWLVAVIETGKSYDVSRLRLERVGP